MTEVPGVAREDVFASIGGAKRKVSEPAENGHDDYTNRQRTALKSLLTTLSWVVTLTEAAGVPAVVLASSDFGRTPQLTGSGTDYHPIGSALVLSAPAFR